MCVLQIKTISTVTRKILLKANLFKNKIPENLSDFDMTQIIFSSIRLYFLSPLKQKVTLCLHVYGNYLFEQC